MHRTQIEMRPFRSARSLGFLAALAGSLLTVGCASLTGSDAPTTAEVTQELSVRATVVAVDPSTRLITLRDAQGITSTMQAGPEVRNFAQIEPGDAVVVRFFESLAVALAEPGVAAAPASAALVAGRAEPGQRPAAAIGGQVTTTVRVELVDTQKNIVVFTPQGGGGLKAIRVVRPEGQNFIRGLAPGDQVQITYTEALAVSVEEQ
jgi:hypothetical protein